MKPIKIAMMSMTHGHTRKYYQVLRDNPKLDWVAVATANDTVKEIFQNSVQGIPCYDSDEAMLDAHPEIEAVVLASENSEHLRQVRLCAERKINILSMKVPTFDMDEYAEMEKLVKESGITLILVSHSMEDMAYYCDNVVVMNGSKVFASGTVSEIFARADELESIGLDIPVISKIAMRLIEHGVALEGELYTVNGVKAALKRMIGGGKE